NAFVYSNTLYDILSALKGHPWPLTVCINKDIRLTRLFRHIYKPIKSTSLFIQTRFTTSCPLSKAIRGL
ncbi:hypothetical protein, partial [Alteromonas sp. W364]|uniref:hypothetical protein n=1 Tax=Alteromonas sp. W364 TaxID=3075610 RepID=UPI0028876B8D